MPLNGALVQTCWPASPPPGKHIILKGWHQLHCTTLTTLTARKQLFAPANGVRIPECCAMLCHAVPVYVSGWACEVRLSCVLVFSFDAVTWQEATGTMFVCLPQRVCSWVFAIAHGRPCKEEYIGCYVSRVCFLDLVGAYQPRADAPQLATWTSENTSKLPKLQISWYGNTGNLGSVESALQPPWFLQLFGSGKLFHRSADQQLSRSPQEARINSPRPWRLLSWAW